MTFIFNGDKMILAINKKWEATAVKDNNIDQLLEEYVSQDEGNKREEEMYIAYKKCADETECGCCTKLCCISYCC